MSVTLYIRDPLNFYFIKELMLNKVFLESQVKYFILLLIRLRFLHIY